MWPKYANSFFELCYAFDSPGTASEAGLKQLLKLEGGRARIEKTIKDLDGNLQIEALAEHHARWAKQKQRLEKLLL
jgi:hypothetical protein